MFSLSVSILAQASFAQGFKLSALPLASAPHPLMEELKVAFDELRAKVLAEVKKKSTSFKDAPLELRGCKDIALAAIEPNGGMFKFASPELQGDPDLARVAVENNIGMFTCISPTLKSDRTFMMSLIESACCTKVESLVKHLDQDLRKDREVMLKAIAYCPGALKSCHSSLKGDKDFVLSAIRCSPSPLETRESLSAKLQRDPAIAQATVESWRLMLDHVRSMPDFDTLMVGGVASLQGEHSRVLRATRVNPVSISAHIAKNCKLFPDYADHWNEESMTHWRKFYNDIIRTLEQQAMQSLALPGFGGALRLRSRSPRGM